MEFTNEFTIPVDVDEAFAILTDLERVAPCMPGAKLESREGDDFAGTVRLKVGPMNLTYSGTATLADVDPAGHTARIIASGRERRGAGNASADVRAALLPTGHETLVRVATHLDVSGKPAQFGRGVMGDVGARLIDRFASNLHDMLTEDTIAGTTGEETAGPSPGAPGAEHAAVERGEALDLAGLARDIVTTRALVAALVVITATALLGRLARRRRSRA